MHKENEIPEDIRASIELLVKIIAIHKPDANIYFLLVFYLNLLYTKYYNLDNTHHDIFLNKTTGDYESIRVELWNTDEQE